MKTTVSPRAVLAALALLSFSWLATGCGSSSSGSRQVEAWGSANVVKQLYAQSVAAADSQYKGKVMGLMIRVGGSSISPSGIFQVVDQTGNTFLFEGDDAIDASSLAKGTSAFVFGHVEGLDANQQLKVTHCFVDDSLLFATWDLRQPNVQLPTTDDYARVKVTISLERGPFDGAPSGYGRYLARGYNKLFIDIPNSVPLSLGKEYDIVGAYLGTSEGSALLAITTERVK